MKATVKSWMVGARPNIDARRSATPRHPLDGVVGGLSLLQLQPVAEALGQQQAVALVRALVAQLRARGLAARQVARAVGPPRLGDVVGRLVGARLVDRRDGARTGARPCACSTRSAARRGGVQQAEDDRVGERLPRRLDDVRRHADGGPRALAVGGVDQHPGDRTGGRRPVEDADLVVGQVDAVELGVADADRGPQRGVDGVDRAVALGGVDVALGVGPALAARHPHLDRGLGGEVAARAARR